MNNNKQSSVEWLIEHVKSTEWQDMYIWHKEEIFKKAKEMHCKENANTWNNAINAVEKDKWDSFEQYYNKTNENDSKP